MTSQTHSVTSPNQVHAKVEQFGLTGYACVTEHVHQALAAVLYKSHVVKGQVFSPRLHRSGRIPVSGEGLVFSRLLALRVRALGVLQDPSLNLWLEVETHETVDFRGVLERVQRQVLVSICRKWGFLRRLDTTKLRFFHKFLSKSLFCYNVQYCYLKVYGNPKYWRWKFDYLA